MSSPLWGLVCIAQLLASCICLSVMHLPIKEQPAMNAKSSIRSTRTPALTRKVATAAQPARPTNPIRIRTKAAKPTSAALSLHDKEIDGGHRGNEHVDEHTIECSKTTLSELSDEAAHSTPTLEPQNAHSESHTNHASHTTPTQEQTEIENYQTTAASDANATASMDNKEEESKTSTNFEHETTQEQKLEESTLPKGTGELKETTPHGVLKTSPLLTLVTGSMWGHNNDSVKVSADTNASPPDTSATLSPLFASTPANASECVQIGACMEDRNVCARCRWWEPFCWAHCGWIGGECVGRYSLCWLFGK